MNSIKEIYLFLIDSQKNYGNNTISQIMIFT